jgi:hypothetical protein
MKSSTLYSIVLVSALAVTSVAFAQGRYGAPVGAGTGTSVGAGVKGASAQGAASTAGTQDRLHTPGTGLTTDTTPLKTRIHTPGTGLITTTPETVVAPVAN